MSMCQPLRTSIRYQSNDFGSSDALHLWSGSRYTNLAAEPAAVVFTYVEPTPHGAFAEHKFTWPSAARQLLPHWVHMAVASA